MSRDIPNKGFALAHPLRRILALSQVAFFVLVSTVIPAPVSPPAARASEPASKSAEISQRPVRNPYYHPTVNPYAAIRYPQRELVTVDAVSEPPTEAAAIQQPVRPPYDNAKEHSHISDAHPRNSERIT